MTEIFRKKKNLEPVTRRKLGRARFIDFTIIVIGMLIVSNQETLSGFEKLVIILTYIFIITPLFLALGGTPGHLMTNLRARKNNNYEKNISFISGIYRIFLLFVDFFIGITSFSKNRIHIYDKVSNTIVLELKEDIDSKELQQHQKKVSYINFAIAAAIYIAWVIWLGNFWFLLGLPIIYDIYISKKVNWTPWKKRDKKNPVWIEWLDALIFAVVAVTLINIFLFQNYKIPTASMENSLLIGDHLFVSKMAYGPRIPHTPVSFPFSQNTMPISKGKSYVEWIKLPYKRLKGLQKIKRNNVVVFNCPALDTVTKGNPTFSYNSDYWRIAEEIRLRDMMNEEPLKNDVYYRKRAKEYMEMNFEMITRPVDKRDNYIKRCVGMPGDTLQVVNKELFINGKPEKNKDRLLHRYQLQTSASINRKVLERMNVAPNHIVQGRYGGYEMHLNNKQAAKLEKLHVVDTIVPLIAMLPEHFNQTYPNHTNFAWTIDNFGPVYIPEKGKTIKIHKNNLPIYSRVINAYEGNDLKVRNDSIFINGEYAITYTFKMNYYFMMGDNRHSSWDSRSWGFVPEDHIVGKPKFVWLSIDRNKTFLSKIRWNRFFQTIK